MKKPQYDLIIIGAGPAGLSAAIYAKRGFLKTLIFEKGQAGGKLNQTAEVENYLGFRKINGPQLAKEMTAHATSYQLDWKAEKVTELRKSEQGFFWVETPQKVYSSWTVIVASGTVENQLKVEGEKEFTNFGVSYCALCDGFLFRGKKVAVVGGGYSACEAALYLSKIAERVYLIHRREDFRTDREIQTQISQNPKIQLLLSRKIKKIGGHGQPKKLSYLILENLTDLSQEKLEVVALFPCIGLLPHTSFLHRLKVCDDKNYLLIKENYATEVNGLFAIGDVTRQKKIKQVATAIADGAVAAQSAIDYLRNKS